MFIKITLFSKISYNNILSQSSKTKPNLAKPYQLSQNQSNQPREGSLLQSEQKLILMIINISKNLWHSQYCTMYIEINPTFDQALAFLILYCMLQLLTTNVMQRKPWLFIIIKHMLPPTQMPNLRLQSESPVA